MAEHYPFTPNILNMPKATKSPPRYDVQRQQEGRKLDNLPPPPMDNDLLALEKDEVGDFSELTEEDYKDYFDYLEKDSQSDSSTTDEIEAESRFMGTSDEDTINQLARRRRIALLLQQRRLKLRQQLLLQQQLLQQQKKQKGSNANMLQDGVNDDFTDESNTYKDSDYYDSGYNGVSNRYDAGTQGSRLASMYGLNNVRKTAGLGLGSGGGLGALDIGNFDYSDNGLGLMDRSHGYGGHGNSLVLLRQPQQQQGGAISQALNGLGLDYETFALGLALAGLVGAYSIYTLIIAKGRRSFGSYFFGLDSWPTLEQSTNTVWSALDDIENKLDSFASGIDADPSSWINRVYQSFTGANLDKSSATSIIDDIPDTDSSTPISFDEYYPRPEEPILTNDEGNVTGL